MYSQTPSIEPIIPAYRLRLLDDAQLQQFQAGTFQILERTGFHCPSERVLKIYAEHGGRVDFKTQTVKLPSDVILGSLAHAPRHYTLGGRSRDLDLDLSKPVTYEATDGTGTKTIDYDTRELRSSVKDDVARSARVADFLSSISFYWPMVSAQDHGRTAPLHELDAAFNNTLKHVQTPTVVEEGLARHAVEMARVIAGSDQALRSRPPLSLLICTIAPLAQDPGSMHAALVAAEAGIPVGFMSMPNTGSTSPATIAGTLVQGDAEIVSAMVLIQMAFPGAPIYHSFMPGMTHPRTGAYYSHESRVYAMGVELAHQWGVPTLAGTFGLDAAQPGWEAAMGGGKTSLLCALCGAEMGSGMGLLRGSTLLYPEVLVLDSELYHSVCRDAAQLNLDPDHLALDVIHAVGPRGHYLAQKHTRQHFRQLPFSEIVHVYNDGGGYRDPIEAAREKTKRILEQHHPQPLADPQRAELKRILGAADSAL